MLNVLMNGSKTEENQKKDFRKLAKYVIHAKGQHRTINGFSADLHIGADYLADIINARITSYPTIQFLKLIADYSEGRVTLKELTLACGYSNYANNDLEQIKNLQVRRGWICYANYADRAWDSEVSGRRLVLVIQNNVGNMHSSNTKVLAITSRRKPSMPTHVFISKDHGIPYDSIISCELADTLTKRRLISNRGIIEKIAECPRHIMERVEVALAKADGTIGLHVSEQDAIEALINLNSKNQQIHQYQNNYNINKQVAYA